MVSTVVFFIFFFNRMSPEEASKYVLEDSLGGRSEVLQRKAIHRYCSNIAPPQVVRVLGMHGGQALFGVCVRVGVGVCVCVCVCVNIKCPPPPPPPPQYVFYYKSFIL